MFKLKIVFILLVSLTLYSCGGEKGTTEQMDKKASAAIAKAKNKGIDSLTTEYRQVQREIEKSASELEALLTEIEK